MSLRVRLIAALFVVTAVGMLALATVTYTSQRSALVQQVDNQLRSAMPGVGRQLELINGESAFQLNVPGAPSRGRGGGRPPGADELDRGPNLPPGAYGEVRNAKGRQVGEVILPRTSYGADSSPLPKLPARVFPGAPFTVPSVDDGSLRYRVLAEPAGRDGSGSTIVAALPLSDVDETLSRLLRTEAIVIAVALLLLTGLAWAIVRVGLRPLDRMAATAGAIAAGDLDRRVDDADPRTEVGRLGIAINGMLARLEGAFAEREASEGRLRQFLSDASHELRTPLASIRGYAELFRVGAVREPDDLKKAMGRIEDEATRMGRLVEDLLLLARLDEEPQTSRVEVDVARLVDDAASDARAVAPDRTIEARTDGEAIVLGDDGRLRQVLANLMRNALDHTPAGSPIEVSSRRDGTSVVVEVRDHGPGLPDGDGTALFGRFWRSEGGRARGRGGAGLGLAIVAALVAAHDGEVRAETVDAGGGGGARFVVRLPLLGDAPSYAE